MGMLKGKYATCPLKKRPLSLTFAETAEEGTVEQTEPEDLSVRCVRDATSTPLPEPVFSHKQGTSSPDTPQQDTAAQSQQDFDSREEGGPDTIAGGAGRENCPPNQASPPPRGAHQERHAQARTSASQPDSPLPVTRASPILVSGGNVPSPGPCRESPHVRAMQALATCLDARPANRSLHNAAAAAVSSSSSGLADTLKPKEYHSHGDLTNKVMMQHPPLTPGLAPPLLAGWDNPRVPAHQTIEPTEHLVTPPQRFFEATEAGRAPEHSPSSVAASRPHRPWLTEDPPRPNVFRSFPTMPSIPHPGQQRHLLSPANFWNGMVPLSWPLPHMLPPNPPPSPGRHGRECGSPGSESASSEGSSGGGRGEARYTCSDCGKAYSTYSGLSKHKQFHCAALGTKSFACKNCEKVYTSLGALKMHIRTHTLPCKCQLCGKAFSRPWLLQGHIRTHTGEKPFQCPQCDRCFADRSNLRAHLQTHADVKKYACGTCHKTFSRMSLLNKHTEAACPALHRPGHP
ncbi:zinc finger protein GLI4-like [Eriocheir sinensis]|uniref:zinc finger protein GLI4-like n=1 Tax=Eriocheir sinensis TaxID=95602 RepID=UPI0021C6C015|nr:zinc finger protein GLI4-like [Eriocheir sinensis]